MSRNKIRRENFGGAISKRVSVHVGTATALIQTSVPTCISRAIKTFYMKKAMIPAATKIALSRPSGTPSAPFPALERVDAADGVDAELLNVPVDTKLTELLDPVLAEDTEPMVVADPEEESPMVVVVP